MMIELGRYLEKRPVRTALTLAAGSLGLLGCGGPGLIVNRPGTVIAHEWHEAYDAGDVPIPEEYHLDVRQCGRAGEEDADAEGCVVAHMNVTWDTYNAYPDGSQITFGE